jgi:hypothetical protein
VETLPEDGEAIVEVLREIGHGGMTGSITGTSGAEAGFWPRPQKRLHRARPYRTSFSLQRGILL